MTDAARDAILRSLCFHEAWGYAPTRAELCETVDVRDAMSREEVVSALGDLISLGSVREIGGRVGFPESVDKIVETLRVRDPLQPRKRRRARLVARWLARLGGVRFVALANTTALGAARDDGDLDFFVIATRGTIWSTRLVGGAPFRLLRWTPAPGREQDAVCLSYFITDEGLDLSSHALHPDDPYFRYWFLSLLPLYDDGVSADLWDANAAVRRRHPFARPWIVPPDLRVRAPAIRLPALVDRLLEPLARSFQMTWFPRSIRERMNTDTTVIVSDRTLKFHTTDNRAAYRQTYEDLCKRRGVTP